MILDATADEDRQVQISALELDVLREHLDLAMLPLVLKVPSPGRTYTERAELEEEAWAALAQRGLGDRSELDNDLERMLRLASHPHREIDGRLWFGRSIRVFAACGADRAAGELADADSGSDAVLAVKDGDSITLRRAASSGLPREATSVLPSLPAGPGRSVTLRSADLDAAAADAAHDLESLRASLRRRGVRAEDADTLTRMVVEAGARGQFGAAVRDASGRRVRAERVVAFFDTPHGRYVQSRRESASGDPWSTVAPVDHRGLVAHIEALLEA